jgi:two-component system phosphate regulon response regulator PhoB
MNVEAHMVQARILIVEDDEDIQELLEYNLKKAGYAVTSVTRGEEGMRSLRSVLPDLVLLDLMLPGLDGLEVCKQMKQDRRLARVPVIMISARGEEADVVIGLELGADDYLAKPFSPRVLLARVKAVLRRNGEEHEKDSPVLLRGSLVIDAGRHDVSVDGERVGLTPTEFGVLHLLAGKPGWVFTRQQIVDAVRGEDYAVTERSVDVQIVGLRKKLGDAARFIETVRGIGYRFTEEYKSLTV